MCISTIIDEACSVEYDIVPKEDKEDSPTLEAHIKQVKDFYNNPNTNKESFEMIRRKYLRDVLEVDSGVINKIFNKREQMVEIVARDGSTFTKNPDIHGMFTDREDIILDQNILEGAKDISGIITPGSISPTGARERAAYFQYGWINGARPIPFGKREIVWFEKNVRTDSIYGRSPVQNLAETIQTLIYAVEHNLEYFNDNSIPAGVLGLEGSDAETVKAFKEQWEEQQRKKDSAGNWKKIFHKFPIVGTTPTFTRFQLTNAELELLEGQKWWSKMVWACYDDQTEILTEDGFKLFKELKNEKVARVNPNDLEIDFVKPINKQEYDFDGELISYKTKSCDLLVTPEHKMLQCSSDKFYNKEIEWTSKEARDFENGIIPQAGNFKGEKIDKLNFTSKCKQISKNFDTQEFNISGDNFAKFMGIWLSDGWIESSNNRIVLCASDVYPENKEFIENLLKDMEVEYSIKISEPNAIIKGKERKINGLMNYYRFSNKAFRDYLMQFGKSYEKYVPRIILNADKKQRELFLDAFMLVDGSIGKKGKNDRYGSMSKKLLDGLQEILIKNGKSATLFQNSFNGCWELTVRKGKSKNIKDKYYSRIIKENVSKQKYNGKVYDVTVPENHFLVVRRNGRVSISGNCFGVTSTELGYTEDSKGIANQVVQSNVFKKRAIYPLLRQEEFRHNSEIISEFEFDDVEFKFLLFDVEEETKKAQLYKTELDAGYKSINEIRLDLGLEEVDWGEKESEADRFERESLMDSPMEQEIANEKKKTQTDKDNMIGKKKDKKSFESNPLILGPNEEMTSDKLKKGIIYLLTQNEQKIKDLIEKEVGKNTISEVKSLDAIIKAIKSLLSFGGLKSISDKIMENIYISGIEKAEKQLNVNLIPNSEQIDFIQDYTFNNIKGMTEEIADDLRQELQRGIMQNEGVAKIKNRITKVFDVGKNRAEMIARTETNRAENYGKLEGFKSSGQDLKKKWLTSEDDKTSDICKRLNGQVVGLNENFIDKKTGWTGPCPPAHVNCRSSVLYLDKEEI